MSRAAAWLCVCAMLAVQGAPAPPTRAQIKDSKIIQEKSTIVVRRMPNAYFYPFSLWPLPKFPVREEDESSETFQYRRNLEKVRIRHDER